MIVFEINKDSMHNDELYLDESFGFKYNEYYAIFTLNPIYKSELALISL